MELHLIRHPRPNVEPGICYGRTDLDVAESVPDVADRLRPLLPPRFALHTSPLRRARLLAEALGSPQIDPRLQEMNFGDWEGRRFDDLGRAIDAWADDPLGFAAPNGESARDMSARVLHWLDETTRAASAEQPLVVVAHGGPLRAIAGHLLGLPADRWLGLDFACGKSTRIDLEAWGTTLKWFNR
ncbi:alpha-ribazole phosphatase family protein [Azoarcus sp. L1K30]|uniref:alpha-ribazole phosphatase family protein n=1 Tax=Azoarcus sp. L1K30 TaxID=2820277 RepID=UPI001B843C18|nr:alpha-ribazole phosphatase family protein [Azoarcus sp. L1K30]MBR0566774.1 alpha-ribazole phosphatase family protein [Azoarcus sp. L1K30]